MQPRRIIRDDDSRNDSSESLYPMIAAETLRSASHRAPKSESGKAAEERVSMFWRVFGGTLLSISALVVITAYQSISGSIHDLRNEVARANEARAEMVKKDEYAATRAKVWDRMQEMQKEQQAALTPLVQLQQFVAALQEKAATRDQQIQQLHEERKELVKDIQLLRERLAKLEAAKESQVVKP